MTVIEIEPVPTPRKPRPTSVDVTRGELDAHLRLCAAIRDARLEAGLAQADLAAKVGVGQTYLSKVERGEKKMGGAGPHTFFEGLGVSLVRRVERALGLQLGTLMTRAGYVQPLGDDGLRSHLRQAMAPSPTRTAIEALLDSWEREQRDELDSMMRRP